MPPIPLKISIYNGLQYTHKIVIKLVTFATNGTYMALLG
jgi:hypothetical protein